MTTHQQHPMTGGKSMDTIQRLQDQRFAGYSDLDEDDSGLVTDFSDSDDDKTTTTTPTPHIISTRSTILPPTPLVEHTPMLSRKDQLRLEDEQRMSDNRARRRRPFKNGQQQQQQQQKQQKPKKKCGGSGYVHRTAWKKQWCKWNDRGGFILCLMCRQHTHNRPKKAVTTLHSNNNNNNKGKRSIPSSSPEMVTVRNKFYGQLTSPPFVLKKTLEQTCSFLQNAHDHAPYEIGYHPADVKLVTGKERPSYKMPLLTDYSIELKAVSTYVRSNPIGISYDEKQEYTVVNICNICRHKNEKLFYAYLTDIDELDNRCVSARNPPPISKEQSKLHEEMKKKSPPPSSESSSSSSNSSSSSESEDERPSKKVKTETNNKKKKKNAELTKSIVSVLGDTPKGIKPGVEIKGHYVIITLDILKAL